MAGGEITAGIAALKQTKGPFAEAGKVATKQVETGQERISAIERIIESLGSVAQGSDRYSGYHATAGDHTSKAWELFAGVLIGTDNTDASTVMELIANLMEASSQNSREFWIELVTKQTQAVNDALETALREARALAGAWAVMEGACKVDVNQAQTAINAAQAYSKATGRT
ncbi:MAG TPA: hypothetical protein VMR45_01635 [Patescibacteria group bacterium]|jgi:hypothetical protein|nr:hypothetical protein [Patescibacteria group bacterium]